MSTAEELYDKLQDTLNDACGHEDCDMTAYEVVGVIERLKRDFMTAQDAVEDADESEPED